MCAGKEIFGNVFYLSTSNLVRNLKLFITIKNSTSHRFSVVFVCSDVKGIEYFLVSMKQNLG
jgi:hypothetical protein